MKKYFLILFFLLFLFIPKDTFAEMQCQVADDNWNVIASSSGDGCQSVAVPYNAHIYHFIWVLDKPKLNSGNDYALDMEWWVTSEQPSQVIGEFIQTYKFSSLYSITSVLKSTINMGQFSKRTLNTTGEFTALSTEPKYSIVINFNDFTHVNYFGINYLDMDMVGNSGTENAIVNGVTDIINNQDSNTEAIIGAIQDNNDLINDDNTTGSVGAMEDFIDDFSEHFNDHGLSTLVTSPLRLIQAFTTENCQPLTFTLPFVHNEVTLQCMRPVIQQNFNSFFVIWQLLTTGLIAYRVSINIYAKIKQFINPFDDRIEVPDL